MCVCVCVRACVHACVHASACMRMCVHRCMRLCMRLCVNRSGPIHVAACDPIGIKFGTHVQIHLERVVG